MHRNLGMWDLELAFPYLFCQNHMKVIFFFLRVLAKNQFLPIPCVYCQ